MGESSQRLFLTLWGGGAGHRGKGERLETPSQPPEREFKASPWFVLKAVFIYERENVRLNSVT